MSNFRSGHSSTFDDVVLVPRHATVHPREVAISSRFTRSVPLNTPVVSAAMDTVTESEMAIAVARAGGIGVIHKNMPIDRHAAEVSSRCPPSSFPAPAFFTSVPSLGTL